MLQSYLKMLAPLIACLPTAPMSLLTLSTIATSSSGVAPSAKEKAVKVSATLICRKISNKLQQGIPDPNTRNQPFVHLGHIPGIQEARVQTDFLSFSFLLCFFGGCRRTCCILRRRCRGRRGWWCRGCSGAGALLIHQGKRVLWG